MQAQAPDHFANVHVGRLSPFRPNNKLFTETDVESGQSRQPVL